MSYRARNQQDAQSIAPSMRVPISTVFRSNNFLPKPKPILVFTMPSISVSQLMLCSAVAATTATGVAAESVFAAHATQINNHNNAQAPNIITILTDDQGFGDSSYNCENSTGMVRPSLESLMSCSDHLPDECTFAGFILLARCRCLPVVVKLDTAIAIIAIPCRVFLYTHPIPSHPTFVCDVLRENTPLPFVCWSPPHRQSISLVPLRLWHLTSPHLTSAPLIQFSPNVTDWPLPRL